MICAPTEKVNSGNPIDLIVARRDVYSRVGAAPNDTATNARLRRLVVGTPRGPALTNDYPLLAAFGASVEWLQVGEDDRETLQADTFDPGCLLRLAAESFDPESPQREAMLEAILGRRGTQRQLRVQREA